MNINILVVDDEASVRQSAAFILGHCGYSVATAASGEEALAICHAKPFDLILTDMRMPGINGQQLLEQLRAIHPEQKVILVTAFPPRDVSLFDAVVLKPYSLQQLREQVSAALRKGRTEAQAR